MGTPSVRSVPNARDSANAQSTVPSFSSRADFSSMILFSFWWMWKPSGTAVILRAITRSSASVGAGIFSSAASGPARRGGRLFSLSRAGRLQGLLQPARKSFLISSSCSAVVSPSSRQRSAYIVGGLFFFSMMRYMSGCVKDGSSPSLCPYLR